MAQSEIKKIIRQLKKKEIRVFDVSEEYENEIQIVTFERKAGLRITGKKGFDIISNTFFVEETLIHIDTDSEQRKKDIFLSFDDFDSYFDFLNGDIYENACYTFCPFSKLSTSKRIDAEKLMAKKAFIEDTIDDYSLSLSNKEQEGYEKGKQIHKSCQQWNKKFSNCNSYDELVKVVENYKKSKISSIVDVSFFFFQYIFADVENKKRFSIIMEYMSSGAYPEYKMINRKFYVTQKWLNKSGSILKEYNHTFNYFFDFVAFLKGNLSNANLLFCDGIDNLDQWDFIDFTGAKLKSSLCEKFGLQYDTYTINLNVIESFECIEKNESETALVLQSSRDLVSEVAGRDLSYFDWAFDNKCQRVHYISDLHLMHRIQNAGCRSKEDIIYVIQRIVNTIANEAGCLLLIDGDVSSDIGIFQLFVKMLSKTLRRNTQVVFTIGNHELWSFPGFQIEQIVSKYRTILEKHGMYLLHNDLLYKEDCSLLADPKTGIHLIKYHDLCKMNELQIADRLRSARYVILGGLGFSGYNTEFNADNGIYRMTMDRTTEIKESKIFEDLYNRLCPILANKNAIILTHTPKKDWCREAEPDKNYVYVSGHTHRNFFHDDGEYRVYSDNQVGYHIETPHLKTFLIDNDYDCFSDYEDGIFEITSEQYNDFYRGKNISMTFQREVNVLYMLKKNEYYCFIHKSRSGSLTILNGGTMKKLEIQDVQYYYDNMDTMISTIKTPLDKFTSFQKRIADMVKQIGGIGAIHGSIVDIDFYNHIYVNPFDLSITGYWASDIINKIVYPSIPALLEKNCPIMFGEYVKLLKGNSENPLALKQQTNITVLPQTYLDTDIYKASREIKKMQKLSSNILTSWYEDTLHKRTKIELT